MSSLSAALGVDQLGIKILRTMVTLEMNMVILQVAIHKDTVAAIIKTKILVPNSQQQLTSNTTSTIQKPK